MELFKDQQLDKMLGKLNSIPNSKEPEREDLLDTLHPEYNAKRWWDVSDYTEQGYRVFRARLMTIIATMKGDDTDIRLEDLKGYGPDLYTLKREIAVCVTDVLNGLNPDYTPPTRNYEDIEVPSIATITTYRQGHKYSYFIQHVTEGAIFGDEQFESRPEAIGWAIKRLVMTERSA